MKSENLVFILSILLITLSFIIFLLIFFENPEVIHKFTGYVSTNYGYINLSVLTFVSINLSVDSVSWGVGTINAGENNATLYTVGNNSAVVQRGNWSAINVSAFVVENIGNLNCSISVQSGKNTHDFFNSLTSSNEQYKFNVSNKEVGSCIGSSLNTWVDVNKTSGGTKFCNNFGFKKNNNEIYIDVLLTVPYDAGNIGQQSDVIVITGDAV
jgi:hypothetical protein